MKNKKTLYNLDLGKMFSLMSQEDIHLMELKSKSISISKEAFAIAILHDFLTGNLVYPNG